MQTNSFSKDSRFERLLAFFWPFFKKQTGNSQSIGIRNEAIRDNSLQNLDGEEILEERGIPSEKMEWPKHSTQISRRDSKAREHKHGN
jgi:hypothetical protein